MKRPPALLMLADGTAFPGEAIGAATDACGEIVFNTSMSAYQEILSDPSSMGRLVAFTYPHLGNCGANPDDDESDRTAAGVVCAELNEPRAQWRSRKSLNDWLIERGVGGIAGVDTRALTLHVRRHGNQNAYISVGDLDRERVLEKARGAASISGQNLAETAGCKEAWLFSDAHPKSVAVLDLGVARSTLRYLEKAGFGVRVWPAATAPETLLASGASALFVAGGPGDPAPCLAAIGTVKKLLGKMPVMGLGLGHLILALALGGRTCKMPLGHWGANQAVRDEKSGLVRVTAQSHGFVVEEGTLPPEVVISHRHVNDGTPEGLAASGLCAVSVQYQSEAPRGSSDILYPFSELRQLIARFEGEGKNA